MFCSRWLIILLLLICRLILQQDLLFLSFISRYLRPSISWVVRSKPVKVYSSIWQADSSHNSNDCECHALQELCSIMAPTWSKPSSLGGNSEHFLMHSESLTYSASVLNPTYICNMYFRSSMGQKRQCHIGLCIPITGGFLCSRWCWVGLGFQLKEILLMTLGILHINVQTHSGSMVLGMLRGSMI